jgi:site-specific DNA-cytosine methylase
MSGAQINFLDEIIVDSPPPYHVLSSQRVGCEPLGGVRMLTPRELYRANEFPDDYRIERDYTGKTYGKSEQVANCGNAVPPPFAVALVRANLPEWCGKAITTMAELARAVAV